MTPPADFDPDSGLPGRIKKRIRALNTTPHRISVAVGMGGDAVRNILSGRSAQPRRPTLEAMAEQLGTTYEWLVSGFGPEVPGQPETAAAAPQMTLPGGAFPELLMRTMMLEALARQVLEEVERIRRLVEAGQREAMDRTN